MSEGIKKVSENVIVNGRALTLTSGSITDTVAIPTGTIRCNPTNKGLEFKIASNSFSKFDALNLLIDGSIGSSLLATDSVTTTKINDLHVTTSKLDNKAATTAKINDLAVTEPKLGSGSVTESKLGANAVTEPKILDRSVTTSKIGLKKVDKENMADLAIENRAIADTAVNGPKIATNAIIARHITNYSLSNIKYGLSSIYGDAIKPLGIQTVHLDNQVVTPTKLADGAVITDKVGDLQITQPKMAVNSVGTINIINGNITKAKMDINSVGNANIEDNAVALEKLSIGVRATLDSTVKYVNDDVTLKKDLYVTGKIKATGDIEGARVLNAVYMDLAEAYIPGEDLEPGDIVEMNEDGKVYKTRWENLSSAAIVGVVSDEYASCYGATSEELESGEKIAVGLIGKVHVKIEGPCKVGMKVMAMDNGVGGTTYNTCGDRKIGKCLETSDKEGEHKVLCLIYPN